MTGGGRTIGEKKRKTTGFDSNRASVKGFGSIQQGSGNSKGGGKGHIYPFKGGKAPVGRKHRATDPGPFKNFVISPQRGGKFIQLGPLFVQKKKKGGDRSGVGK